MYNQKYINVNRTKGDKMKNKKKAVKDYFEVKDGVFNLWICLAVITGLLMFMTSTVILTCNIHKYVLISKGIMAFLLMCFLCIMVFVISELKEEENYRYVINAYRKKIIKGNVVFEKWNVYINSFYVTENGLFNSNIPVEHEDVIVSSSNEDYEEYAYQKTVMSRYCFYTKIYDRNEKAFLSQEKIMEFMVEPEE